MPEPIPHGGGPGPVPGVPTAEQQTRQELAERQQQLEDAQRIANLGSWHWDVDTDHIVWSDHLFRMYGIAPGTPLRRLDVLERVVPEDREQARTSIEAALDGADAFDFEERIRQPDGSVRLLRTRGAAIRDASGRAVRLLGVSQDITGQREAEEAARRLAAEEAARAVAETAVQRLAFLSRASEELASSLDYTTTLRTVARLAVPVLADWAGIDMVMEDGRIERLAVEHVDPDKVELAREIQRRYPPDPDAPAGSQKVVRTGETEFVAEIPDALLEGAAVDAEHLRMLRALGLRSYICAPLHGRGRVLGTITVVLAESGRRFTDAERLLVEDLARRAAVAIENAELVSELHDAQARLHEQAQELEMQAEEMEHQNLELIEKTEELERVNRVRTDFLATVSHELRTPLNAIIGYAELLLEGVPAAIPEDAMRQVERIRLGARHLLQLIDEILTFSSLEAGRQSVVNAPVRVADLVDELRAIVEPLAGARGLSLHVTIAEDAPETIQSDGRKLRQILINLLGNASKFTEHGHLGLHVHADPHTVTFSVEDTGPGIAPEDFPRLFEPFWQADQSLTRNAEGAGLGLAIADRLARMIGGRIDVESKPDTGSVFRLVVPAER